MCCYGGLSKHYLVDWCGATREATLALVLGTPTIDWEAALGEVDLEEGSSLSVGG